jgi:hypothetical protein
MVHGLDSSESFQHCGIVPTDMFDQRCFCRSWTGDKHGVRRAERFDDCL